MITFSFPSPILILITGIVTYLETFIDPHDNNIYTGKFQHDRFILGTYIAIVRQWIERLFPKQKAEGSTAS